MLVFLNLKKVHITLDLLSKKTGLTPNTLSKILAMRCGVDRRSLVHLFSSFELILETDDFLFSTQKNHQSNLTH